MLELRLSDSNTVDEAADSQRLNLLLLESKELKCPLLFLQPGFGCSIGSQVAQPCIIYH